MPCLCTANTLRLFVRSVAQVNLPLGSRVTTSRQLPRRALPNFHTSRAYSATAARLQEELTQYSALGGESSKKRETWKRGEDDDYTSPSPMSGGGEGAIAEISLEAIDAIVAEAATEESRGESGYGSTQQHDTPLRSLMKGPHKTKRRAEIKSREPVSRTKTRFQEADAGPTIRRMKSENTSFKLHYSADPNWEKVEERRDVMIRTGKPWEDRSGTKNKFSRVEELAKSGTREGDDWTPPPREPWMLRKAALKEKFPDGYQPLKRLSPDAIAGIRALHAQLPDQYTTPVLAQEFKVSPEAIARILKSKWKPTPEEQTSREERWFRRGEKIWTRLADMGMKPPKQWREMGIGSKRPDWMQPREGPRPNPPALITMARRKEPKSQATRKDSLGDRII